jgi:hypothetical protein
MNLRFVGLVVAWSPSGDGSLLAQVRQVLTEITEISL